MDKGLKEIHVDYISTEQVKKLIEVGLPSLRLPYNYQIQYILPRSFIILLSIQRSYCDVDKI